MHLCKCFIHPELKVCGTHKLPPADAVNASILLASNLQLSRFGPHYYCCSYLLMSIRLNCSSVKILPVFAVQAHIFLYVFPPRDVEINKYYISLLCTVILFIMVCCLAMLDGIGRLCIMIILLTIF